VVYSIINAGKRAAGGGAEEVVEVEAVEGSEIEEADGVAGVEMPTTTTITIPGTPILARAVEHRQLLLAADEAMKLDRIRRHEWFSY
jgi:hypothetical protein